MISLCILTRDEPHLETLINMCLKNIPCKFEIVIGDNSTKDENKEKAKSLADVYVPITDKQIFRMGIPFCHNVMVSHANTYKIFYIDADEYPIWVHPEIEDHFDLNYVLRCVRWDFVPMAEILQIDSMIDNKRDQMPNLQIGSKIESVGHQDRIYNCRYAKFEGVCHSVFHVPMHFRENNPSVFLLHNKTVREAKNQRRMDDIMEEQGMKQNINPMLASTNIVLGWYKYVDKHRYNDYDDFKNYWDNQ